MSSEQILQPLGKYVSLFGGGTPSKDKSEFWNGDIPWASVKDLTGNRLKSTQDSISALGLASSASKVVKASSIIIATRMAVGRVVITDIDVAINQDLKAITCSDKLNSKYLFYFLRSQESNLNKLASGATVKGIKINHIMDMKIPLPPLAEQQKIAAILDAADSLRQKDQQLVERYTALSQSLFLEMFGDPVANPMGWDKIELGSLAKISSGSTPSRDVPENYSGNIPWVKTGEVNGKNITNTSEFISEKALANSSCKLYPIGSLIIAMYGQGKTRGQVARLSIEAATNQACAVIPPSNKMNYDFLFTLLKLLYEDLRSLGRGGNQPNLNSGLIKAYGVVSPSLERQNKFAERIQLIEAQKQQAQQSLTKSEALFNSLLQRAFTGELTAKLVA